MLWSGEGRRRKDIAELLGVLLPTVDRWKTRYAQRGPAGLEGDRPGGTRNQVPASFWRPSYPWLRCWRRAFPSRLDRERFRTPSNQSRFL
ncbi:helix-turn-helix domain-containing protein [Streptomyces sp. NBC_01613]|uniref:helix-turn-helix domain-containing protein n=1 Tax=Streptomyces sp. NBC_01613 TaxID=2975896 RepID=UPI00386B5657